MKTINLQHPHGLNRDELQNTVAALGYFDGVHLGHQKVIQTAKAIADENKWQSAVMTFHPHPAVVLGKADRIPAITPLAEKEKAINKLGIDILYVVRFDEAFSRLSPQQFIEDYIVELSIKHVVAGFDYTYGRFGKGTMATMQTDARGRFDVTTVEKVEKDNEKISSTLIRSMIGSGEVEKLPQYLGRYYEMSGTVITGEKRGRTIGFPTANLSVSSEYVFPKKGVYAVKVKYENRSYNGVLNIGYKPTFHDHLPEPSIEVHILDFDQEIYGERLVIEWRKRLRDEKKFNSAEELIEQIKKDKREAEAYFQFAI
mgnify:FL=1